MDKTHMSDYADTLLREPNHFLASYTEDGKAIFDANDRVTYEDQLVSVVGDVPLLDKIIVEFGELMWEIMHGKIKAANPSHLISLAIENGVHLNVVAVNPNEKEIQVGDKVVCRFNAGEPVRLDYGINKGIPCLVMYRMSILTINKRR